MSHSVRVALLIRLFWFDSNLNSYLLLVRLDMILYDEDLLRMHLNSTRSIIWPHSAIHLHSMYRQNDFFFISSPISSKTKTFLSFFFKFFPVANDFESKNKSYRLSILSQVKFLEFEYRILYVVTINEDGIGDHLSVSQSWPGRAAIITIQLLVFRIVDFTVADFCIVMYKGKLAEQREQDYATKLGNNSSILFTFLFTTCWSEPSSCLIVILSLEWFDSVKISRHVSTQDICLQWVFFSIKAYSFEKEWPIWRAITVERCSMNRR